MMILFKTVNIAILVNRATHSRTTIHFYEHSLHIAVDFRIASFVFYAFLGALHHLPLNELHVTHIRIHYLILLCCHKLRTVFF